MFKRINSKTVRELSDIHNIKSADSLSKRIHDIRERYRMDEYDQTCQKILKAYVPGSMHDKVSQGILNPRDVENLSPKQTSGIPGKLWYKLYCSRIAELGVSHNIEEYEMACTKLVQNFYERRREFLINTVIEDPGYKYPPSFAYGTGITEEIVSTILRENIRRAEEKQQRIRVLYEDFDGSLKTAVVIPGDDRVEHDGEHCIAKPNSHWTGDCYFDSFRVDYYWDTENEAWVGIPVSLVYRLELEYHMESSMFMDDGDDGFE